MLARYALTGALLTGGLCHPPTNDAPLAQCETDVVLVQYGQATNCDLQPPQTLVIQLATGGDADMLLCDNMGGQILFHKGDTLCLNVDY